MTVNLEEFKKKLLKVQIEIEIEKLIKFFNVYVFVSDWENRVRIQTTLVDYKASTGVFEFGVDIKQKHDELKALRKLAKLEKVEIQEYSEDYLNRWNRAILKVKNRIKPKFQEDMRITFDSWKKKNIDIKEDCMLYQEYGTYYDLDSIV